MEQTQKPRIEKAFKVKIGDLRFLSVEKTGIKETLKDFDWMIEKLERF